MTTDALLAALIELLAALMRARESLDEADGLSTRELDNGIAVLPDAIARLVLLAELEHQRSRPLGRAGPGEPPG